MPQIQYEIQFESVCLETPLFTDSVALLSCLDFLIAKLCPFLRSEPFLAFESLMQLLDLPKRRRRHHRPRQAEAMDQNRATVWMSNARSHWRGLAVVSLLLDGLDDLALLLDGCPAVGDPSRFEVRNLLLISKQT